MPGRITAGAYSIKNALCSERVNPKHKARSRMLKTRFETGEPSDVSIAPLTSSQRMISPQSSRIYVDTCSCAMLETRSKVGWRML